MMLILMIRRISTMVGNGNSDNRLNYQTIMDNDCGNDGDGVDVDDDDHVDDE